MGLIIGSNNIITVTPVTIVYPHVTIQGRVCTDGSSSSGNQDSSSFDRTLYRVFSMQDDMKTLQYPSRVRNEFELFIEYATKKTNGEMYDSRFDQLDAYLGSLGVSNVVC